MPKRSIILDTITQFGYIAYFLRICKGSRSEINLRSIKIVYEISIVENHKNK